MTPQAGPHNPEFIDYLLRTPLRRKMVGWYDPRLLAQSAWLVIVANLFGRHSDTRLIEALSTQPQHWFDYSADTDANGDFWLDYVSDIGDGWNSTYAIADAIATPKLAVADAASGATIQTSPGRVLVFGGDEVYPYPSRAEYEARAERPYATAFAGRDARPDVFAIPGNHDWYDSLIAFSRSFCRPERGFAGCATHQTRSYFALRLPHDWWLLAIDLQLGSDLDEPQVQYFQQVAADMDADARVLLCVPEPRWILEDAYPRHSTYDESTTVDFLERRILKRPVDVFLTGDLHLYKRHSNAAGIHKITAGGGGAFLHPTHAPATHNLRDGFVQRAAYPDEKTSSRLTWRNFLFPFLNPKFLPIPAFLYAMSAWFASASLTAADTDDLLTAFDAAVRAAVRDPVNGLWLILVIAAFIFFTDTHVRWWRVLGGISHGLAHLAAAFGVGWLGLLVTTQAMGLAFATLPQLLVAGAITFLLGGLVGAWIIGLYLFVSLQFFGRHANEAFASLRIEDFKHWVRLRVDASGTLSIFALAIDRVPRRWRAADRRGSRVELADDPAAAAPRLIDSVVVGRVRRPAKAP
ncbi:MAG: hypothetical protein KDI32_01095 [Pseudomonadales bacterium]|nr:hypothetical protein [Pseudomonadales bacterium]